MAERMLYVGDMFAILSDAVKTQELLDFVKTQGFTELTFYTGGPEETRAIPLKEPELAELLKKVAAANVKANIAIGSAKEMDRVMAFITKYAATVDGFVLEYEWWNNFPRDFENAATLLKYMRSKAGTTRQIGAYIGWTEQKDMTGLIPLVNKIFIHAYVPDGKRTYNKVKSRLDQIMTAAIPGVKFYPLFSAEWLPPEICNQGTKHPSFYDQMCFMGPWLKANGGVAGAEAAFKRSEAAGRTSTINWRWFATIAGFAFYEYKFLKDALK